MAQSKKAGARTRTPARKATTVRKPAVRKTASPATRAPNAASATNPTELIARLRPLDDAQRAAFSAQFTDAECAVRGATTRSAQVRSGALAWAGTAYPALANAALAGQIDYSPERLAWLLELVLRLDAARADASSANATHTTVRSTRDVARAHAQAVRRRLLRKLERVVRGDPAGQAAYDTLTAAPDDNALVRTLQGIGELIDTLARADASTAIRMRAFNLAATDAGTARAAAERFNQASDQVGVGGRAQGGGQDTSAVNVVEGRVLFELLFLRDAFAEARERGVAVAPLVPPPGLQRALAYSRGRTAEPTAPNPSPAPANPPS